MLLCVSKSNPLFPACQERLMSVVYGLLRQSKLHFLTALREVLLAHLKNQVKEVMVVFCRTDPDVPMSITSVVLRFCGPTFMCQKWRRRERNHQGTGQWP